MTLNGEKRKLKMAGGTSEQVDCLSNAEAYVPSEDLSTDVAAVLQHCQVLSLLLLQWLLSAKFIRCTCAVVAVVSNL